MSGAELGRAFEAGRADPREITEIYLDRIAAVDPAFSIYARLTAQRARAEAEASAARTRSGMRLSPLDGVPASWKDLFDTAGVATESGTRLLAGRIPDTDAVVLHNATGAGAVCLGKTHQTEFAFSGLGINPKTSTPPNRAMPGHAPGGSSSGAAASIAHDIASIAIGSDTGGSVRIPAAWNNLVGLKTTHGLLPAAGIVPLCPGFDTAGPLTRTVEDAALASAALSGQPFASPESVSPAQLKLAIADTIALEECDPLVMAAFEASIERLTAAGVAIERVPIPEYQTALDLGPSLFPFEAWQSWGSLIGRRGDEMHPPVRARFEQGIGISREQYDAAWQALKKLRVAHDDRMSGFDAILSPTVPILPPSSAELLADDDFFTASNLMALRNTRFINLLGGAALTLPLPQTGCGLQLAGPPRSEAHLLAVGAALEKIAAG